MFPWLGQLDYLKFSRSWAIKRCYLFGRKLPVMRLCRAMVWRLPDAVTEPADLVKVIDHVTKQLQKDNPDLRLTGIKLEK